MLVRVRNPKGEKNKERKKRAKLYTSPQSYDDATLPVYSTCTGIRHRVMFLPHMEHYYLSQFRIVFFSFRQGPADKHRRTAIKWINMAISKSMAHSE